MRGYRQARAPAARFFGVRGLFLWVSLIVVGCGARTGLAGGQPSEGGCGLVTVLEVSSTVPWSDTEIDVTAGQRLRVVATGSVTYGGNGKQVTDANGGNFDGQKFFMTAVLPTTVVCSLVGKVGGTTAIGTGTPLPEGAPNDGPGFVGTSYDQIVPVSGRLFLGFNDQKQAFGDNSGAFTVTITLGC